MAIALFEHRTKYSSGGSAPAGSVVVDADSDDSNASLPSPPPPRPPQAPIESDYVDDTVANRPTATLRKPYSASSGAASDGGGSVHESSRRGSRGSIASGGSNTSGREQGGSNR